MVQWIALDGKKSVTKMATLEAEESMKERRFR
jgi:hypothetical protein